MRGIASYKGTVEGFKAYLQNRLMPAAIIELEIQARADLLAVELQLAEELSEVW